MSLADRVWNPDVASNGPPLANDFRIWSPGDLIPATGERLLIGLARWCTYDRKLLALLESLPSNSCRIDLFDADRCESQGAVRDYIPRIGFVHHMPIVGYWRDGLLVESECGHAGRHLIYRVLGLDPQRAEAVVIPTRAPSGV
jgi:hypothetical protein